MDETEQTFEFKSLAAFKRAVKVGTTMRVLDHWQEKYVGTVRTVTKTQGNGYWFTMTGFGDKRFWSKYGAAADHAFDGNVVTVNRDGEKGWTLEVLT